MENISFRIHRLATVATSRRGTLTYAAQPRALLVCNCKRVSYVDRHHLAIQREHCPARLASACNCLLVYLSHPDSCRCLLDGKLAKLADRIDVGQRHHQPIGGGHDPGGLAARNWIISWFLAVLLASTHTLMTSLFVDRTWHEFSLRMAICALWPFMLLCSCAPLVLMRSLWGWSLARRTSPAITRCPTGLEDLVLFGVILACTITTTQVFLYVEGAQNLPQLLFVISLFGGVSLLTIPVTVGRPSGPRAGRHGWAFGVFAELLALVIIAIASYLLENDWSFIQNQFQEMLVGVAFACVTVAVALTSLLMSGYQLTYFARADKHASRRPASAETLTNPVPAASPAATPWDDEESDQRDRSRFVLTPKWQARI